MPSTKRILVVDVLREYGESATAFGYLMSGIWLGESDCSPEVLCLVLGEWYPTFVKRTQQDAQEFLMCVLNELHEPLKKKLVLALLKRRRGKLQAKSCHSVSFVPGLVLWRKFEGQGNYKRKLLADICYPLSNLDISPSYPLFHKNPEYSLCALVIHFGFLDGGHYTAFCKRSVTKNWLDDSQITKIPNSSVQIDRAYLLFYTCQAFSALKGSNKS
ncbi:LOW QUALITY PROTEIN: ubiquitin carboxyl-terminal hydrolase 50 [Mergus octosetaceus]